jgi:nitrile hydratase accessory protein
MQATTDTTALADRTLPAIADIPLVLTNADSELVFNNPWEAKAFAMVVQLYQQGHFTWPEWAEALSREIKAGGNDDGQGYYLMWLAAAEQLITGKALCDKPELAAAKATLEHAQGGPAPATNQP